MAIQYSGEIESASELYDTYFEKYPHATELVAYEIYDYKDDNDIYNMEIGKYGKPIDITPYSELMLDYEYTWKDKMAELDEQVKDLMDKEEFAKGGMAEVCSKCGGEGEVEIKNNFDDGRGDYVWEDCDECDNAREDEYTGGSRVLGYVAVLRDMKSSYYKDMPKKGDILPFTKENCDRYDVCHSVIAWYKGRGNEYSLKDVSYNSLALSISPLYCIAIFFLFY